MKRFLMLTIISICLFTLTGCGNSKTLTCFKESESTYDEIDNTGTSIKLKFNKAGDKVLKFDQIAYIIYNKNVSTDDFNDEYDNALDACEAYKEYAGVTCKVTKTNKKITLTVEVNTDKADDTTIEKFSLDELEGETYDTMKKDAETNGYTCK